MEWTFIKQGCEHEDLRRCRHVFCCSASLHKKTVARLSFKRPIVHRKADGMQLICNGARRFPSSVIWGYIVRHERGMVARLYPGADTRAGGGLAMTFEKVLTQALAMLQRQGRVSYRALKRQFG